MFSIMKNVVILLLCVCCENLVNAKMTEKEVRGFGTIQ